MARAPISLTVFDTAGNAVAGASVDVKRRSDNATPTIYSAETGSGTLSNPLTTDAQGRLNGAWLDRGAYKLTVSKVGTIVTYVENFDASPGGDGTVDTAWASATFLPIGAMFAYAGPSDPAGGTWLVCNGRLLSRATYATLFGIIGTTYGAGDGSTTFAIPNTSGRSLMGPGTAAGAYGATAKTLGQVGGEETHATSITELPAHTHDTDTFATTLGVPGVAAGPQNYIQGTTTGGGSGGAKTTGGNTPHNNLHPFVVTNHIIRAL